MLGQRLVGLAVTKPADQRGNTAQGAYDAVAVGDDGMAVVQRDGDDSLFHLAQFDRDVGLL